ncbi:MAG: carboxypeptidase-like regulatory domain-containing protein, partial [archaeon]|nr:carboxypeptidase-like regulatory domain-containing protein [archaeon]
KLSILPSEVAVGEDFTAKVVENESGNTVGTATVHLKDKEGGLVHSIAGNNSNGSGLDGRYEFENSFDPGIYTVEAVAEGFKPAELELIIAQDKLLEVKPELKISIAENQTQGNVSTSLKNLSSFDIQEISYELIKPSSFPDEFYVTIDLPPSLNERQEGRITINVEVDLGENSEDSLHGELEVEIKGTVGGTFPTKTKTKVIIDYNKKLDPKCLKFDKRQLRMRLIGRPGSTAFDELEIENKCEEDVSLKAKVDSSENDPNLQLTVNQVTIKAGKSERVKVTALNKINRLYALSKPFTFQVTFESNQVAKSIPVTVELWNPSHNLAFPPSVALWLARRESQNLAMDTRALYVTNTGQVPITSFRMALSERTVRDYPGLRVDLLPNSTSYATIGAGQPLSPSRFVHAEFAKEKPFDRPAQTFVEFNGVVMGRRYGMGQTSVAVNWQGYNCLILEGKTAMNYASKEKYGTQFKEIKITNNCLDAVRVRTVEPNSIQGNVLSIIPGDLVIEPKTTKDARLQLAISKETRFRTIKVKAKGLLVRSQQFIESDPLEITVDIGEKASTSEGKATVEKE